MLGRLNLMISGDFGNGKPIMRLRDWLLIGGIILFIWLATTGRLDICDPTPGPDSAYPACEEEHP